jgi:hypothetical protein
VRRCNRLLGRLLDPLCVTVRPPAASLPNLQSNIFKARSSLLLCAEQLPSQRSHFPDVSLDPLTSPVVTSTSPSTAWKRAMAGRQSPVARSESAL